MGLVPSPLCAAMARAVEPQPQPSSSIAIAALIASTPEPPYSSGIFNPNNPSGPILRVAVQLNSDVTSTSWALGCTSLATKSCTVFCQSFCSTVKSKFILSSIKLKCNNLLGFYLRFKDVTHPTNNANLYLFGQIKVIQACGTNDQADALIFQSTQLLDNRRIVTDQFDTIGIKADRSRQTSILHKQLKIFTDQNLLKLFIRFSHAVVCDQDDCIVHVLFSALLYSSRSLRASMTCSFDTNNCTLPSISSVVG